MRNSKTGTHLKRGALARRSLGEGGTCLLTAGRQEPATRRIVVASFQLRLSGYAGQVVVKPRHPPNGSPWKARRPDKEDKDEAGEEDKRDQ